MSNALLHTIDEHGIVTLTLNRPDIHNAFDDALIADIIAALGHYRQHSGLRALVLRANGKSFSAGADLSWMKRMASYSREANQADAEQLEKLMADLYAMPCPTIALVQGAAMGGAVGLISCCDIALGSFNASFALSEVRLGLAPAVISPFVIAAIGARQAGRYFLTGERFDALTAKEIGLLHEVVEAEALDTKLGTLLGTLLDNGPQALIATKALLRRILPATSESAREYTTGLIADLRVSAEGQEGLGAFFEKRPASWRKKAV